MTNRSQQKGTDFESLVLPAFQAIWPDAHRLGKQGIHDKGDIWLPGDVPFVIECKNEAKYSGKLSGWVDEALVEAITAGKAGYIVVHKRYRTRVPEHQFVTTDLGSFLQIVTGYDPPR